MTKKRLAEFLMLIVVSLGFLVGVYTFDFLTRAYANPPPPIVMDYATAYEKSRDRGDLILLLVQPSNIAIETGAKLAAEYGMLLAVEYEPLRGIPGGTIMKGIWVFKTRPRAEEEEEKKLQESAKGQTYQAPKPTERLREPSFIKKGRDISTKGSI